MEWLIGAVIFLAVCLGITLIYLFRSLKQTDDQIEAYLELDENYDQLLNYILILQTKLRSNYRQLQIIDNKGSFEADDEVGFFFKDLMLIADSIDEYLDKIQVDEEEGDNGPSS